MTRLALWSRDSPLISIFFFFYPLIQILESACQDLKQDGPVGTVVVIVLNLQSSLFEWQKKWV